MSLEADGVWSAGVWSTSVWAEDVWREGEVSEPEPTPAEPKHAGKPRRHRYIVEIDDQTFEVNSILEAQALLDRAQMLAEQQAAQQVRREVKRARRRGRTEITLDLPEIETDAKVLEPLVLRANERIRAIFERTAHEAELRELMRVRLRQEEEDDAIIALMLH